MKLSLSLYPKELDEVTFHQIKEIILKIIRPQKGISLVSLFHGISTFMGLFNAKAILVKEQLWYYLTHNWRG